MDGPLRVRVGGLARLRVGGLARVLVAPDKFRGSLTAPAAAAAMAAGVHDAVPPAQVLLRPVADGGEGTVDAFAGVGWERVPALVAGPTGEPVTASIAWEPGGFGGPPRAVVELADCCGMQRLPGGVPAPVSATSRGAGEAVLASLRRGAREVTVGLGGSASTDGGAGFLAALGAVLRDADGRELGAAPSALHHATSVDLSVLAEQVRGARLVLATDVTHPLTGGSGAAAVFGPQKGADASQVAWLAAGLERWADVLAATFRRPVGELAGGGAAGGVPAGVVAALSGVCDVAVVSGARTVVAAVGIPDVVQGCDLVVTGEGSFDDQTLAGGKAPAVVADVARAAGVPVLVVAGRVDVAAESVASHGIAGVLALADVAEPGEDSMTGAAVLVRRATARGVARFAGR